MYLFLFHYLFVKKNNYSQLSTTYVCVVINYNLLKQKKKRKLLKSINSLISKSKIYLI